MTPADPRSPEHAAATGADPVDAATPDFRVLFEATPGINVVLAPDPPRFTMLAASDERLAATATTRASTIGRPLFEVLADAHPANPGPAGVASLRASLEAALRTRAPHRMAVQRHALRRPDGSWEERHWLPINIPVTDADGTVRWILHHVEDVTDIERAEADLRESEARLAAAVRAEQQARRRAEALHQVTAALLRAATSAEVGAAVVRELRAMLDAESCWVGRVSDDGGFVETLARAGCAPGSPAPRSRFPLAAPLPICDAIRDGNPRWWRDAGAFGAAYPRQLPASRAAGIEGAAIVPLLLGEGKGARRVGALWLGFRTPQPFDAATRGFASALAQQCAQAIERVRAVEAGYRAREAAEAMMRQLEKQAVELEESNVQLEESNVQLEEQAVELEHAAEELRAQRDAASDAEARATAILESVTDAFYAVDRGWRFTYVNRRAEELWEIGRDELLGRRMWDCFPEAVGSEPYRRLVVAMTSGEPVTFETRSTTLGRWIRVHAHPSAVGLSVYFTDITAEREMTAERARRADMVELLQQVAVAANAAPSVAAALTAAVRAVCATLGWPVGHAFTVHRDAGELVSTTEWRLDPPDRGAALRAASARLPLRSGTGAVGRACEGRRTAWVADLLADETFDRRDEVAAAGLRAGMAVPVLQDGEVAAVLEFFCPDATGVDDELVAVLDQIGSQLGRVVERERERAARQLLLQRIVAAQEDERRRLSREVHDKLGQHLTALQLQLRALRGTLGADAARRLDELEALVHTLDADARALAVELRPTVLDDVGLASAVTEHATRWSARTGIPVDVHVAAIDGRRFKPELETALYRTIQEALTNVARHAEARRVSVIVRPRDEALHAVVEDDGRGFAPASVRETPDGSPRLGLVGMRERIAGVGGALTVESSPGRGTAVFARVPLGDAGPAVAVPGRARAGDDSPPSPRRP